MSLWRFRFYAAVMVLVFSVWWCVVPAQVLLENTPPQEGKESTPPVTVTVSHALDHTHNLLTVVIAFSMRPYVYAYKDTAHNFALDITSTEGLGTPQVAFPANLAMKEEDGDSVAMLSDGDRIRITCAVHTPEWGIEGSIRYQACDTARCFFPETRTFSFSGRDGRLPDALSPDSLSPDSLSEGASDKKNMRDSAASLHGTDGGGWKEEADAFTIVGRRSGYMDAASFTAFLDNPGQTRGGQSMLMDAPVWMVLLLVIAGGLLLNFTPCVLPIIPITLAVIGAGAQAHSRMRGFVMGSAYSAGMVLSYGVLGVVVIMTGKTFGFLNASPWFNAGIAVLFVVLALAMFDVFHIDFTRFRSSLQGGRPGGGGKNMATAFAMGAIAAILAGACVAPVVISVVLYSTALYSSGVTIAVLLPFVLGMGMALPWPFAGAGLSFLPKPGNWMTVVRSVFGVVILAIGLFYAYTAVKIVRARIKADTSVVSVRDTAAHATQWFSSLEKGLVHARTHDTPVLIDFGASWCKNCNAMHATTFKDERVVQQLREYTAIRYMAESPDKPATRRVLDYFRVVGMPTFVVLEPGDIRDSSSAKNH